MATSRTTASGKAYTVEIAVAPQGALVAYSDGVLDGIERLRINHADGSLTALSTGGHREFPCGYVSTRLSQALLTLRSVLWARFAADGERYIKVMEVSLDHA